MKTITRTFTKPGRHPFMVIGEFEFMNARGTMQIDGDPEHFQNEIFGEFSIQVSWETMTGEFFQHAFLRNTLGWNIETEEFGEWGMLEL